MNNKFPITLSIAFSASLLSFATADETEKAEAASSPGVVLNVVSGSESDLRHSKRIALTVGANESPTSMLPAGKFTATWEGHLNIEKRSRVYFSFEGSGAAELFIDGESVLKEEKLGEGESERQRLNSGLVPIKVVYTSPDNGAGSFRLMWRGRDFASEPVPASILKHEENPAVAKATLVRKGRALFAEMKCAQCHEGGKGMPEATEMAPSLAGVGDRLDAGWMEAWLKDPKSLRAHARMPQALSKPEDAAHIAAYLEGLTTEKKPVKVVGDKAAGGKLFHDLGCIACHRSEDGQDMASWNTPPIDLFNAGHKYKEGALAEFLKNPSEHHAATRMPDFNLEDKEAADLAAFVRSLAVSKKLTFSKGDVAKGKELTASSHCAQCHEGLEKVESNHTPLAQLAGKSASEKSCVGNGGSLDYGLSEGDAAAINAFLESQQAVKSLAFFNKAEYAHRQFTNLNCASCHQMDAETAHLGKVHELSKRYAGHHGEEDAEEAAHAAIAPPSLTYIGDKLTVDYMKRLFDGSLEYRTRPWVTQRMPEFPSRAKNLAEGFAAAYGVTDEKPSEPYEVETGKTLFGMVGGFACATCHGAADAKPIAVFEAPGINLQFAGDRLREDFYHRWMKDPQRIDPLTIMPKYFVDDNETTLTEPLGGEGDKQMQAIWSWMQSLNKAE